LTGGHTQISPFAPRRMSSRAMRSDCPCTADASGGKKSFRSECGAPASTTAILSRTSTVAKSSYPYSETESP
jgi:hypothetical protein